MSNETEKLATSSNVAEDEKKNIVRPNFYEADLIAVNFEGADLRAANFEAANMCGASFHEAGLCGSDFTGADFRGAILYEAILPEGWREALKAAGLI